MLPSLQQAMVYATNGGPIELTALPVPATGPGDLLVRIQYAGMCYSDFAAYHHLYPMPQKLPLVGGHEGVGEVVAVGRGVTDWQVGQRAGIRFSNRECGECTSCTDGNSHGCDGPGGRRSGWDTDGTWQQYAVVLASQAIRVPAGPVAGYVPLLCRGITAYAALEAARVQPGQWVAVFYANHNVGRLVTAYAKAMGCKVVGVASGDARDVVVASGVDHFVAMERGEGEKAAAEVVGLTRGVHASIMLLDKDDHYKAGIRATRTGGSMVLLQPSGRQARFLVFPVVSKNLSIIGCTIGSVRQTEAALQYLADGRIACNTETITPQEIPEVLAAWAEGQRTDPYIVVSFGNSSHM